MTLSVLVMLIVFVALVYLAFFKKDRVTKEIDKRIEEYQKKVELGVKTDVIDPEKEKEAEEKIVKTIVKEEKKEEEENKTKKEEK